MTVKTFRILKRQEALSDSKFELLKHFVSEWVGLSVDADGLLRLVNAGGSRPPLIWCFNGQEEMPVLADGLDADQPLIGMRSLNLIERLDGRRLSRDEALADYYTGLLLDHAGLDECVVGGNCQGASIAVRVAANLRLAGKKVGTLITMEAQSVYPFPGRVALIFGDRSEMFNPFLRNETPQSNWNALFGESVAYITPGGHGQYFTAENAPELCRIVSEILGLPFPSERPVWEGAAAFRVTAGLAYVPDQLTPGSVATLMIALQTHGDVSSAPSEAVAIRTVWKSVEHGVYYTNDQQAVPLPVASGAALRAVPITTPDNPGMWDLYIFVCSGTEGPISWAENYLPKATLLIGTERSAVPNAMAANLGDDD